VPQCLLDFVEVLVIVLVVVGVFGKQAVVEVV